MDAVADVVVDADVVVVSVVVRVRSSSSRHSNFEVSDSGRLQWRQPLNQLLVHAIQKILRPRT